MSWIIDIPVHLPALAVCNDPVVQDSFRFASTSTGSIRLAPNNVAIHLLRLAGSSDRRIVSHAES